jgi:hypothetical protein
MKTCIKRPACPIASKQQPAMLVFYFIKVDGTCENGKKRTGIL